MIINGIAAKYSLKFKVLLTLGIFFLVLLTSFSASSQTAEDEKNFQLCKACHTIGGGKLVGPDLKGVNDRHPESWTIKFIQNSQEMIQAGDEMAVKLFKENNNIPMPSHNLTDDQVRGILAYIKNDGQIAGGVAQVADTTSTEITGATASEVEAGAKLLAEKKGEERRNMQSTFIIMLVLMLISIIDLVITKLVKARWIHIVIILVAVAVMGELTFVEATALGRQQYYQPDQPIAFSHKIHAGQNRIDCKYCHFTATESMHAGIPPVALCMNCHTSVKSGKKTGTVEIEKIYAAIDNNKPIEWIKVGNLADHVYFNHAQHVKVGKIDCQQCHGEVQKMDQVIQVGDFSMGWCIDCHRNQAVQFAENKFYDQYTKLHKDLKEGVLTTVTVKDIGGDECQKCHY
ncbi:MAG: c-type cytochrome [Bacteroidales bacterium]|nr:c-type cytochrome [Bacteroidales bacterium]